jgi:hypothetical protein
MKVEEIYMCPVCITSAAVVALGAGSKAGIVAVCLGKLRKIVREKAKEK